MRTRVVVIAAVVGLLLLVAGAGAVYAYDRAHAEEIGKDVRVGDVDVSGMTEAEARAKLRERRARAAQPPGRRARDRQALHAHARAGEGRPSTSTAPCAPRWSARATATC